MKRGTGRRFAMDTRDGDHLARMVVPAGYKRRPRRTWAAPGVSDQGPEGSCVGWATAHVMWARPRVRRRVDPTALYDGAKQHDEWPGVDYEGTSVRGVCKYLRVAGLIQAYRWSFSTYDLLDAIDLFGPAVLGIDWPRGMRNPRATVKLHGRLHVVARFTGSSDDEGHCLAVVGYDEPAGYVHIKNSHGPGYGIAGRVVLPLGDLEAALRGMTSPGEAATLIEQ